LVGVTRVDEQDLIVAVEEEHAGSDAQGWGVGGGDGHPGRFSWSRRR
jgi:hypothetical protein